MGRAEQRQSDHSDGITVKKVKRDTAAALFARYEGDVEDHQILLTLLYEVI